MNILFIGDVVGRPGRIAIEQWLPAVREEHAIDVVIANAENAAGGIGATPDILKELSRAGIHGFTLGNHSFRKKELAPAIDTMSNVVRPANYPAGVPGRGAALIPLPDGRRLGIVNLLGRVYLEAFDCPFHVGIAEVDRLRTSTPVVIVDMHAEATSEKQAMGWFLDGHCTAVLGTHTHVQTADERILPNGTACITDVGMTGPKDSVIGTEVEPVLRKFLTGMPTPFEVAKGPAILSAVVIQADDTTGKATGIQRIMRG